MRKTSSRKPTQPTPEVQTSAPMKRDVIAALSRDEFAGQGGSFVFDPNTGKRTRRPPAEK
jgi:hypothetical protein